MLKSNHNTNVTRSFIRANLFHLPPKTENPTKVLECDEKTPDAHVPGDKKLIRLTGVHPFNCELLSWVLYMTVDSLHPHNCDL